MSKLNTGFQVKVIAIFKNIVDKNIKFLYQQIKLVMHFTPTPLRLLLLNLLGIVLIPIAGFSVDVKNFGAKGDGITDDTEAIRDAITGAEDGVVEFPRGSYRITQNIEINFSQSGRVGLVGKGGSTRIIQEAEGPAFRFIGLHDNGTSDPASIAPVTWEKERMPLMEGFEIVGRISDSATVAGNYANEICGVSCTGVGEDIVSGAVASKIVTRVTDGFSLKDAFAKTFDELKPFDGFAGAIAIDKNGNIYHQDSHPKMVFASFDGEKSEVFQ